MRTVAFSPDGVLLASGGDDDTISLWDSETAQHLNVLTGYTAGINSIVFSPDRSMLASGSSDDTICLWDLNTGKCVNTFTDHTDAVLAVAFSPDGKMLASGCSDYTVRLWDVRTGQLQETFRNNGPWTFDIPSRNHTGCRSEGNTGVRVAGGENRKKEARSESAPMRRKVNSEVLFVDVI